VTLLTTAPVSASIERIRPAAPAVRSSHAETEKHVPRERRRRKRKWRGRTAAARRTEPVAGGGGAVAEG
jgi:hypothetical protein